MFKLTNLTDLQVVEMKHLLFNECDEKIFGETKLYSYIQDIKK